MLTQRPPVRVHARGFDAAHTTLHPHSPFQAVDDAGHDANAPLKVNAIEAVDAMLAKLFGLLWREERSVDDDGALPQTQRVPARHVICVTADHSTPVTFGDHSLEPVPFAVARLEDAVEALGEQACLASAADPSAIRIRNPAAQQEGDAGGGRDGGLIAAGGGCTCGDEECHNRWTCKRLSLTSGALMEAGTNGATGPDSSKGAADARPPRRRQAPPAGAPAGGNAAPSFAKSKAARPVLGASKCETVTGAALGFADGVATFSEVEAVHGVLGRFPGSEAMPLLKRFAAATADSPSRKPPAS